MKLTMPIVGLNILCQAASLWCRLDNLVLDPGDKGKVLAVLDWELSTLGHPIADLAYSAMPYHLPRDSLAVQALPVPLPEGEEILPQLQDLFLLNAKNTKAGSGPGTVDKHTLFPYNGSELLFSLRQPIKYLSAKRIPASHFRF